MRPIFINSSPNTKFEDFVTSIKQLLLLNKRKDTYQINKFEHKIEKFFGSNINACAFDSARSSFYFILKSWGIKPGDEVIVPAFTCVVIVNPILWLGAKPIYADIDLNTLNINLKDLESKINDKTKVILVQHTFGLPVEIEKVANITKNKNIKIVEDCAHSLGIEYKGRKLGVYGDAAVITFGMTKVISGVRGGMAITKDKNLYSQLKKYQNKLPFFPFLQNLRALLNPIIWTLIPPIYYLGYKKLTLGKFIIQILHLLKIIGINNIVEPVEEYGVKPNWIPAKMSGNLAVLASKQLDKLDLLNKHRQNLAKIYTKELGIEFLENSLYLRFNVFVKNKKEVLEYFRKKRIILGDWYKNILHIPQKYYSNLLYTKDSCPNAEYASAHSINLPTFIKVSPKDVKQISKLIKPFLVKND